MGPGANAARPRVRGSGGAPPAPATISSAPSSAVCAAVGTLALVRPGTPAMPGRPVGVRGAHERCVPCAGSFAASAAPGSRQSISMSGALCPSPTAGRWEHESGHRAGTTGSP